MHLFQIIFGATLIVAAFITLFVCIKRTPHNLRGFYGAMFGVFAAGLVAAGIALVTFGAIQLA